MTITQERDKLEKQVMLRWKKKKGYSYPMDAKQTEEWRREYHRVARLSDSELEEEGRGRDNERRD